MYVLPVSRRGVGAAFLRLGCKVTEVDIDVGVFNLIALGLWISSGLNSGRDENFSRKLTCSRTL